MHVNASKYKSAESYSARSIRNTYRYYTGKKKVGENDPRPWTGQPVEHLFQWTKPGTSPCVPMGEQGNSNHPAMRIGEIATAEKQAHQERALEPGLPKGKAGTFKPSGKPPKQVWWVTLREPTRGEVKMNIQTVEGYRELQPKTKKWIRGIVSEWQLEEHHMRLLVLAGANYDTALAAKAIVDKEGPCVSDRFDQKKAHPMVEVSKQASITFCRLLREVGLDLTTGPEGSRPPGNPGGY